MAEVKNLERLNQKLAALSLRAKDVSVTVGYTQYYAIYVHEDLKARHDVGQAKYLEQPARTMQPEMAKAVVDIMRKGGKLEMGMYMAGLILQRASQELVPVRYGDLKRSAFTRMGTV